jgi:hypothetical protein
MAEHDDVLHVERGDAEFERGRNAVSMTVGGVGRHDVGDVAHHEQLARASVKNDFRQDTRVATADHHGFRRLSGFRQFAIAILLAAQTAVEKGAISFDKAVRKRHYEAGNWPRRSGNSLNHATHAIGNRSQNACVAFSFTAVCR